MTSTTAALLHSSTALAAVRAERDAELDLADAIMNAHPSMTPDDALAQARQDLMLSGHAIGAAL